MRKTRFKKVTAIFFAGLLAFTPLISSLPPLQRVVKAETSEQEDKLFVYFEDFLQNTSELTETEKTGLKYYFQYPSGDTEYPYYLDIPQFSNTDYKVFIVSKATEGNGGVDTIVGVNADETFANEGGTINVVRIKMKNQLYIGQDVLLALTNPEWGYNPKDEKTFTVITEAERNNYESEAIKELNYGYSIERTTLDVSYDLFNSIKLQAQTKDVMGYNINTYWPEDWASLGFTGDVGSDAENDLDDLCNMWVKGAYGRYFSNTAANQLASLTQLANEQLENDLYGYDTLEDFEAALRQKEADYWATIDEEGWYELTAEDLIKIGKGAQCGPAEWRYHTFIDYDLHLIVCDLKYGVAESSETRAFVNQIIANHHNIKFPGKVMYNGEEFQVAYTTNNSNAFGYCDVDDIYNIWLDDNFALASKFTSDGYQTCISQGDYVTYATEHTDLSDIFLNFKDDYITLDSETGKITFGDYTGPGYNTFWSYDNLVGVRIGSGIEVIPTQFFSGDTKIAHYDLSGATDLKYLGARTFLSDDGFDVEYLDFSTTNLQFVGYTDLNVNGSSSKLKMIRFNENVETYYYSTSTLNNRYSGNQTFWILGLKSPYWGVDASHVGGNPPPLIYSILESAKYGRAGGYSYLSNKAPFYLLYYRDMIEMSAAATSAFNNTTLATYIGPNITGNMYGNKITYNDIAYPGYAYGNLMCHTPIYFVDILEDNWDNLFENTIEEYEDKKVNHVYTRKSVTYSNMADTDVSNFQTSYFKEWYKYNANPANEIATRYYSEIEYEQDKLQNIAPAVKEGYTFVGYTLNSKSVDGVMLAMNDDGTTTIPEFLDENLVLTANFAKDTYTVNFYGETGASAPTETIIVGHGDSAAATFTPSKDMDKTDVEKTKYTFSKWVSSIGSDLDLSSITEDIDAYPSFSETKYHISSDDLYSIEIITPPDKTVYDKGETFDKTGLSIKATYKQVWEDEEVVYHYVENATFDADTTTPLAYGATSQEISKTDGSVTKTVNQSITVNPIVESEVLDRIIIVTPPNKVEYDYGETFDRTGMTVNAIYKQTWTDNSVTEKTVENVSYSVNNETDALTHNDTTKIVSVTDGVTKTATVDITINKVLLSTVLDSIAIVTSPNKTDYYVDETFNSDGMQVDATYKKNYSDGSTDDLVVNNVAYSTNTTTKLTYQDNNWAVTFSDNNVTKSAYQDITVTPYTILEFYKEDGTTLINSMRFLLNDVFVPIQNPSKDNLVVGKGTTTYTFSGWKTLDNNLFAFNTQNTSTAANTIKLLESYISNTTYSSKLTVNYYDYLDDNAFANGSKDYLAHTDVFDWNESVTKYTGTPNNKTKVVKTDKNFDNTQVWAFDNWSSLSVLPETFTGEDDITINFYANYALESESYIDNEILDSIQITNPADKTTYDKNDTFDKTGLTVDAKYKQTWNDGYVTYRTETDVQFTTDEVTPLPYGKTEQIISYTDGVTVTTVQPITVNPIIESEVLDKIVIITPPTKTSYSFDEIFDRSGMTVNAIYAQTWSNNTVTYRTVTNINYAVINETAKLTHNDNYKTVSFTDGSVTKTAKQDIFVDKIVINEVLDSIAIVAEPDKTVYNFGEKFDKTGMVVDATYKQYWSDSSVTNKTVHNIAYSVINEDAALTHSDVSKTISFTDNLVTKTTEQPIVINKIVIGEILDRIVIATQPTKTVYVKNELFNKAGMVVNAIYKQTWSDNTQTEKTVTNVEYQTDITTPLPFGVDKQLVSFTDGVTKTTNASITVQPIIENVKLYSISIAQAPDKIDYFEGELFDKTGMIIDAKYEMTWSDNSKTYEDINDIDNYVVDTTTALKSSDDKRIISFTDDGITKTANQPISVSKIIVTETILEKIDIVTPPNKTAYFEGEKFDKTGMVVDATYRRTYNNGDTDTFVVKNVKYLVVDEIIPLTTEDSFRIVSFTDNGITKTAKQAITVKPVEVVSIVLERIDIITPPDKVVYYDDDLFDRTGMVVDATYKRTYNNGSTDTFVVKDVEYVVIFEDRRLTLDDTEMIVSYSDGAVSKKTTQPITVKPVELVSKVLEKIDIVNKPDKLVYYETEVFDRAGMVVDATYILTYNNGSTEILIESDIDYEVIDELTALTTNITSKTVSFTDNKITKTAEQDIVVKPQEKVNTVQGRLTYSNGKPMVGMKVVLHSVEQIAYTDENGYYKFEDVEFGEHSLTVYNNDKIIGQCEFIFDENAIDSVAETENNEIDLSLIQEVKASIAIQEITLTIDGLLTLEEKIEEVPEENVEIPEKTPVIVPSPNTGDSANYIFYVLLLLISGVTIAAIAFKKRKN